MCANRTAWSKSSSLPSDRIPPPKNPKNAPKSKQKEPSTPKSRAVRRLEKLSQGLKDLQGKQPTKDPIGGCFCQAREHELSQYTSICRACGLILCEINHPYHSCPHCKTALLTPTARDSLIASIEQDIADTMAREEREREQAAAEAKRAAGAFPALAPSPSPYSTNISASSSTTSLEAHPVNQSRKVLSLNSKTKKVIVSSFTNQSRPITPSFDKDEPEEVVKRISAPPPEVPFISRTVNPDRLWFNMSSHAVIYVPPPVNNKQTPSSKSRRKTGGEISGKENVGGSSG